MISQLGQLSKHFNNSLEILLKHFKKCWTISTIVWNISNFLQNIVNIFVIFSIIVHNISNNSRNISKQCCKQCKNVRNISNSVCNNLRMFWLFFFTFLAQWVLKTSKGYPHLRTKPTRGWFFCFDSLKGNYLSPNIPEATISWPDDDDDDDDDYDFALIPRVFDRTPLGTVLSTYDHLLKLRGIPTRKLIF